MTSLLRELHPRRFFLETWRAIDEDAKAERASGDRYDLRPLAVLVFASVCLTFNFYVGKEEGFRAFVEWRVAADGPGSIWHAALRWAPEPPPYADLIYRYWWAGIRVVGYMLVPMAFARFALGGRLRDYGFAATGLREHAPTYGLAFAVVLACVVAVSFSDAFVHKYPFYGHAGRSVRDLVLWEIAYAAQFLSLEFFYRGFLLAALRPALGSHAIFVMTVPYVMVHFGKPAGETLGAIFAGVFLGTLAMRTRSIWSGFLLHVGVAIGMDLAALIQTDRLPTRWSF